MKNFFRSIQTYFPALHDVRFDLKFFKMKMTKTPHENDFNALKQFNPKEDQVLVDIGSNRGESICSMLLASNLSNKIVGFEPNKLVFDKLIRRFGKDKKVILHNVGLGSTKEKLNLFIPFYRNWMFDGLSSFNINEAREWLKTRLWNFKEVKLSIKEVPCQIETLDSYNLRPCFIKIDVQGFELEVLRGAKETITEYKPVLLIESITEEVIDFLKPIGYDFYSFENGSFKPGNGILNTFCSTKTTVL